MSLPSFGGGERAAFVPAYFMPGTANRFVWTQRWYGPPNFRLRSRGADTAEGFGRIDTNIANGRRASTAVAYVHPARRRGNLELLSDTIAARIVIEGNRARGVEI
ncbi:MAG TPA: GMC family oxidoreductase N-terminal domain-containing protein, partial [Stellaceae bacterium]|nr:GMC family oxidoreductase N-terminal domain-containing protein [Stellaceae bacterium]